MLGLDNLILILYPLVHFESWVEVAGAKHRVVSVFLPEFLL